MHLPRSFATSWTDSFPNTDQPFLGIFLSSLFIPTRLTALTDVPESKAWVNVAFKRLPLHRVGIAAAIGNLPAQRFLIPGSGRRVI